jgi:hypothetical protein
MQGFALKNVSLSAYEDDKLIFRELGEMLFTHFGVSGPLVLSASAKMRRMGSAKYRLEIDLKPGLDEKKLDARLLRDFGEAPNRDLQNSLSALLPGKLILPFLRKCGLDGRKKVHDLTREERRMLLTRLKDCPIEISGTRPIAEAIVTSGGIPVKEIDPKTMASKRAEGLYFAGEIVDVDAYTGGFNLQIALSTGRLAGKSAANPEGC